MGRFVGIDLGTTYSVVAYINAQGKAEVITNENGRSVTPSVIYFGGDTPLVGDVAKEQQEAGDPEIASFFKRNMDDAEFRLTFHGRDYTATDLSALVLSYMKQQAENFFGEPVTDAVITVPAYFEHNQRSATIEAGRKAGLNVLKIISEPTAAALAYGLRPTAQAQDQTVLVYDLGGGTFDVSMVSITPTDLVVIATDGDHQLGGKDWDDRLIDHLARQFELEFGIGMSGEEMYRLRVQVEKLKRSLSLKQSVDIRVQAAGQVGMYTVTRAQFEDLTRDLMERTQTKAEQVLSDAGRTWQDLSGVLPVGGSTKMPMVTDYIQRISGRPPMSGINPDEAVGLGAAIQAAMEMETKAATGATVPQFRLAGRKATVDVMAHSLGLIAENADRTAYLNSIIIRKNLPIPSIQVRPYQMALRRGGRTKLEVFLTQSESSDPQQCVYLGRYVFSDFPRIESKIAVLDIAYEYDKNGVVHISAVERSTGQSLKLETYPVPSDVRTRFIGAPTEHDVREPLTVYLAFDVSGSMYVKSKKVTPLEEAKKAAEQFVNECDMTMTSIGLIAFSDSVHIEQEATQSNKDIIQAIHKLPVAKTGGGNEADPFDEIYALLQGKTETSACFAIVLADGRWYHPEMAVNKAKLCFKEGIEIIAIGFGGADQHFLARIASSPEHSYFTDLSKLVETFSTIARELTSSGGELHLSRKTR